MTIESGPEIEKLAQEPKSCQELLDEYELNCEKVGRPTGEIIDVELIGPDFGATRIAAPIDDGSGREIVAGELTAFNPAPLPGGLVAARIEPRDDESSSRTVFFVSTENPNILTEMPDAPIFNLQDPFSMKIGDKRLFGGVETFPRTDGSGFLGFRTLIYEYEKDIKELQGPDGKIVEPMIKGPDGMKGIRLVELPGGRIGIFTRPQGEKGGLGKIGYFEVNSLEEITDADFEQAEIIPELFQDNEWGGVNEASILDDGRISVLGHIARFDESTDDQDPVREYYPITFIFDPSDRTIADLHIIATPDCVSPVIPKKPGLRKVMYPGGVTQEDDGTATLWSGLSDATIAKIRLPENPFENARQA